MRSTASTSRAPRPNPNATLPRGSPPRVPPHEPRYDHPPMPAAPAPSTSSSSAPRASPQELVAEVLAEAAPRDLRWALAGRSRAKLEAVRQKLGSISSAHAELRILIADSHDEAALAELAERTKVVCTTVGPYMKYGRALAAACARAGTHYTDLTGEVPLHARLDRREPRRGEGLRRAHRARVRVRLDSERPRRVHGVGVRPARARAQPPLGQVLRQPSKGGVSGGTAASMMTIVEEAQHDRATRKLLFNPYALDPAPHRTGPDGRDPSPRVAFDEDLGTWVGPFFMGVVNSRVVRRRSDALLGRAYGKDFRYAELWSFPKGPRGYAMASAMTYGFAAIMGAAMLRDARSPPAHPPARSRRGSLA